MPFTFECRTMLSVEYTCMLSMQAFPTRKSSYGHAYSKSCHLSAPPWGCMMVMSVIIIITIIMQCQAHLHWWASMLSSTIMMQTPLRSLPLLPARPLIWMYSPLFTHLFPTHSQSPYQRCNTPMVIVLDTKNSTCLTCLGYASSTLLTTAKQMLAVRVCMFSAVPVDADCPSHPQLCWHVMLRMNSCSILVGP